MKESLRRSILFTVIVVTGSVMILFDIPLIVMIPFVVCVGFVILVALGAITVSDIRDAFQKTKLQNLKKSSPPGKSEQEKSGKTPSTKEDKKSSKAGGAKAGKTPEKKSGFRTHLESFVSSIGSLGTVIRARSRQGKKVEDIDKLLDKTISEKVSRSALATAGNIGTPSAVTHGGGAGSQDQKEEDPFLSLSGDEFDEGLLDELDDQDMQPTGGAGSSPASTESSNMVEEPENSLPEPDFSSETENILKENSSGLEEFDALDGADTIDQDFEDLENISLDDVDLGDETGEAQLEIPEESTEPEAAAPQQQVAVSGPVEVKNDWIASDTPQEEDDFSAQSDMAAFAGGSHGSDEDLLSSLAAEVKHVKKENDLSLLRDLKDFKAPAEEIAGELEEVFQRISSLPKQDQKNITPADELK